MRTTCLGALSKFMSLRVVGRGVLRVGDVFLELLPVAVAEVFLVAAGHRWGRELADARLACTSGGEYEHLSLDCFGHAGSEVENLFHGRDFAADVILQVAATELSTVEVERARLGLHLSRG